MIAFEFYFKIAIHLKVAQPHYLESIHRVLLSLLIHFLQKIISTIYWRVCIFFCYFLLHLKLVFSGHREVLNDVQAIKERQIFKGRIFFSGEM